MDETMTRPQGEDETQDPVVVFGPLRGGTTMIRLMLDGHEALSVPGESDFLFDHLHEADGDWHYDKSALEADRIYQDSDVQVRDKLHGEAAVLDMVEQVGATGNGRPVLMLHRELEKAVSVIPNVKVIRLLRDPRDVARSAIGMGWAGNVYHGLDPWLATEQSWQAFADAHPEVPTLVIRYEDLVAEPERILRSICDFLSITYDRAMLAYPDNTTYAAPDPTRVFQWRHKMSEDEVALVEARAADAWDNCGYELSGQPVREVGAIERRWLWAQNRAAIWRGMIQKYGVVDPVLRGFGRRLGITAIERRGASRMDEVDRRSLK